MIYCASCTHGLTHIPGEHCAGTIFLQHFFRAATDSTSWIPAPFSCSKQQWMSMTGRRDGHRQAQVSVTAGLEQERRPSRRTRSDQITARKASFHAWPVWSNVRVVHVSLIVACTHTQLSGPHQSEDSSRSIISHLGIAAKVRSRLATLADRILTFAWS
jgi:hypothetical protein